MVDWLDRWIKPAFPPKIANNAVASFVGAQIEQPFEKRCSK